MRLAYSDRLRSNFLVIEEPFEERNVARLLQVAHMHSCDRGGGTGERRKVAVAYRNSDGSHSEPKLVGVRTLRARAVARGALAA